MPEQKKYKDRENPEEVHQSLQAMGDAIRKNEEGLGVLVPARLLQMKCIYDGMKILTGSTPVSVTATLHEPVRSMGCVTIAGDRILFSDGGWLVKIAAFADNLDIYPLTNGKVRVEFTIHGLVRPVRTGE